MVSAAAAKKCPRLSQLVSSSPAPVAGHKAQVRLVDEGGGLERLAGRLMGEFLRGQLAQLRVDQR
jgi:hypothetical protein